MKAMRLALALALTAGVAGAEPTAEQAPPAPAAPPGASPPATDALPTTALPSPAAPPTVTTPAEAPAVGIACVVGSHPAEWPDSARTATSLVCEALRSEGIRVGAVRHDPAGASAAYVVNLDQLGTMFYLRVEYEEPVGSLKASRRLPLSDLAEAEQAAPRIARSFATGERLPDTQNYENVVGSESRNVKKKKGEIVVGPAIVGLLMPASGQYLGPGFAFFLYYETTHWGLGGSILFGDGSQRNPDDADYMALSLGARHFFTDADLTPMAGAGLALSRIDTDARVNDELRVGQGDGLAAYLEGGVEAFRLHSTHLIVAVRADFPFYSLSDGYSSYDGYGGYGSTSTLPKRTVRYEVPVTLQVGIGF